MSPFPRHAVSLDCVGVSEKWWPQKVPNGEPMFESTRTCTYTLCMISNNQWIIRDGKTSICQLDNWIYGGDIVVIWSDHGIQTVLLADYNSVGVVYDPNSRIDYYPLEKQTAGEAACQVYDWHLHGNALPRWKGSGPQSKPFTLLYRGSSRGKQLRGHLPTIKEFRRTVN